METTALDTKFARIGARLKLAVRPTRRFRMAGAISLDAGADGFVLVEWRKEGRWALP